jgi:hypothetical protein
MTIVKPLYGAAFTLLAFLILPGCSFFGGLSQQQKAAVAHFGKTSAAISNSVPPELASMRNRTVRMRIDELSVIYPVPQKWPTYRDLDKDFEPSTLQARVAAAQALAAYGNLLEALATSSDSSALKQAVGNFRGSVSSLTQRSLSVQELDGISQAVEVVAGIYIESRRAEALKTIVEETRKQTTALCTLLAADFDPNGGNLMSAVKLAASRLEVDADAQIKKSPHAQNYGALIRLYWEGSENRDYAETVGQRMLTAINRIKEANDDLFQALQAPEFAFKSPADLEADVKEIQAWVAILKN